RSQKLLPEHNGTLVFEDLLEGPVTLTLRNQIGLRGVGSVTMPLGGGDAEVTVRMQPVGYIRGLLTRADGSRVPAGRVDAYQGGKWLGVSTTRQEGEEGRFLFGILPVGTISLVAWDPDVRQVGKAEVQVREGETTEVNLRTQDKGPVVITVTQEGQPVLRAGIRLRYQGGAALDFSTEATADSQGKASFVLPPGEYYISATDPVTLAEGHGSFSRANDQGDIEVSISLAAVRSLWATTLPPPGAPAGYSLAGWKLRAVDLGRTVILDSDGQGLLRDLSVGMHSLALFDTKGFLRAEGKAAITADGGEIQSLPAPLQARAIGDVTAQVVDAAGAPVSDISVYASNSVHGYTVPVTDLDGRVRFHDVYAGHIRLSANGAEASVTLTNEGEVVDARLQLAPVASVHGTIRNSSGQPTPFVRVDIGGWNTATDLNGTYRMDKLPLRQHSIVASSADGRRRVTGVFTLTQPLEDPRVDLVFAPVGMIQGTISDPLRPGKPLPVTLRVLSGGTPVTDSAADGNGQYRISSLPAGVPLRLVGTLDDGRTTAFDQAFTLENVEGSSQTLDLVLPRFVDVKGWTLDGHRNKIPMTVILRNAQGHEVNRAVTTGDLFDPDHPTFFFRYLQAGQPYRLDGCREMTNIVIATLSFTPVGDKILEMVDLQQPLPHTVRLALVYPDGTPAPGPGHFVLTATGILGGEWQGNLGVDGSATFTDLPNGPFRVRVSSIPNQPNLETLFDLTALPGQIQDVPIPAVGLGTVNVAVKTASGRTLTGTTLSVAGAGTPIWSAQLQGDGTWQASGVWIGRSLTVQGFGFGLLGQAPSLVLSQHGQSTAVNYPAPDQGALTGIVRDARGNAQAGARVELLGTALIAITDAAGSFRFEPVAIGNWPLRVTLPGRPNRALVNATLGVDAEVHMQDLALKGTGTVQVKVLKEDGSAYAGQTVVIRNTSPWADGGSFSGISDAAGTVNFPDTLEGALQVSATLDGQSRTATGVLVDGGTLTLELRTRDITRIAGRVRRALAANAWPSGSVAVVQGFSYALQADGTLVAPSPEPLLNYTAGSTLVQVNLANGASFAVGSITLLKNDVTMVDLQAPAFGSVQGVVRDSQGALVANALIRSGSMAANSDAQGAYRLDGLATGSSTITASLPGRPNRAVDTASTSGDGGLYTLNLTLKGTGTVTVRTLATNGSDLGGQVVRLTNNSSWSDGQPLSATSNAQGLATFTDVLEGSISASATLDSLACSHSGTLAATQTLALTLQPRPYSTISGRIQRANSSLTWPQGTRVLVSSWNSFYNNLAEDGTIQVPNPSPHLDYAYGTASVYVVLPGGRQLSLGSVTLVQNGDTVLNLTAPGFGSLSGTVKNSVGTPLSGVSIQIDGASAGTTDAAGAWSKGEIQVGNRHITANAPSAIAAGDLVLTGDGGTASLDLTLLSNSVALTTSMSLGRVSGYASVYADGSFSHSWLYYWSRSTQPLLKIDGGTEAAPTAPGGIAQWLDKDHQLTYTTTMGAVEVTLTRTVAPQTYVTRDEIRLRNTDTSAHTVSLRHAVYLGTLKGLPSQQTQPVMVGTNRDQGVLSSNGTLLWGNGADAPLSVNQNGLQWPEWTLAPGEQKTLALAQAPYVTGGDLRPEGATRVLDRVLHGATEWIYGGEPSTWSNWLPAITPAADPLAVWNATATLTLKDFLGRVPVNQGNFSLLLEPREVLAPRRGFSSGSVLTGLPADGGTIKIAVPGISPRLALTQDLATTQSGDLLLPEAAPITVTVQDAHGTVVPNASVSISSESSYATNAQGLVGPVLVTPGAYTITAYAPNSENTIRVTGDLQAQAGSDNTLTLDFPAVGSVALQVNNADGTPYAGYNCRATLQKGSVVRSASAYYTYDGKITWSNLLPGAWALVVNDPRTGGNLAPVVLSVSADAITAATISLPALGQIQVQVLQPNGSPVARDLQVRCLGPDGANRYLNTDDSGRVLFSAIAPGVARISATHPTNQLPCFVDVALADGGSAQAVLNLPGSGSVVVNLRNLDGRPARERYVRVMDGNQNLREFYLHEGTVTLDRIPVGRDLRVVDGTYGSSAWSPRFADQAIHLNQDGETKTLDLTLPLGSLNITVTGDGGTPLETVYLTAGGQSAAVTLANGTATILNVPLDMPFSVAASVAGYLSKDVPNITVTSGQPVGTLAISLIQTHTVNFSVQRTNGNRIYYKDWTFTRSGSTATQSGGYWDPSTTWQITENGEFTFTGSVMVGTHKEGSVNSTWYSIWPWTAKSTITLSPGSPDPSLIAILPALSSFTLHLKAADGTPLACDRSLKLALKNSTVPSFLPNLPTLSFNPRSQGADLVMGEHFPEGTHTFVLQDSSGVELSTFDLVVRPEDDARRLEQNVAVIIPAMASLTLHYKDALGRNLQNSHNLQLVLKQSSVAGYAPNLSAWGFDPTYGQIFPVGTHTFAVMDSAFGELTTFDLVVAATDDGTTLERILNLPYVRSTWAVRALASDQETPAMGSNPRVYCPNNGYSTPLNQFTGSVIETPSGTILRAAAEYRPFGKDEFVRSESGDRTAEEGLEFSEDLTLALTVTRFRLLETDGQSAVENAGCDLPGIRDEDFDRKPYEVWVDDQDETRLL
ncbi:MAG: carboxypeptidase-like regulatory domain-containing protein, partial [Holophaga sp.]|nr:carboxypeptidase-like regulatory domain-containing protein [Holophaga sp.]